MRARQESAQLAEKPITIVHALSIAAGIGLMLSVIGYAAAGVKGSVAWVTNIAEAVPAALAALPLDLVNRWTSLALSAALVSVVIASIAAYFIFVDE